MIWFDSIKIDWITWCDLIQLKLIELYNLNGFDLIELELIELYNLNGFDLIWFN